MTSALARAHGLDIELDGERTDHIHARSLPEVPRHLPPAVVLASARETLLAPASRRRHGAHYTPYAVARRLASIALDALPWRPGVAICDPAAGAGVFLIALADELCARGVDPVDAVASLWGADIDPLSVAVARTALRFAAGGAGDGLAGRVVVGDSLADGRAVWGGAAGGFGLVVGNPPFLNQLQRASTRTRHESLRLSARFGDAVRGYVDASALFLLAGLDLVDDDGVVLLLQPQSCLTARDAARVRATIDERACLEGLWFCRDRVFEASVRVCAPVIRAAAPSRVAPPIARWVDRDVAATTPAPCVGRRAGDWSALATDLLRVPAVAIEHGATLGDLGCRATSGFRDQFYGFVGATYERSDRPHATRRLVTVGMIDPLGLAWGTRAVRFAGRDFVAPVVDCDALDERLSAWTDARRGPKLLVATQTKVIEVAVDDSGDCVPLTPVVELRPPDDLLWLVAAALTNPVATATACRIGAGSALALDAIKLSARQVLELPAPVDAECWQRGAVVARAVAGAKGDRRPLWRELAETMCAAYRQPIEPLTSWWLARLPKVALTAPVTPC
jgi:hypothetical protein